MPNDLPDLPDLTDSTRLAERPRVAPSPAPSHGSLKITRCPDGRAVGRVEPLRGAVLKLGRDVACPIALNDPDVSRTHAVLALSEDGLRIADLQSTNGTMVNGVRIAGEVLLKTGDTILVGATVLQYTRL
jgi:pSer/pThr/pTyr-binding forkhead associated (FHA) protein